MARKLITARLCYFLLAITWMFCIGFFIYLENNFKEVMHVQDKIFEMNMDNFVVDAIEENNELDDDDVYNDDDYANGYEASRVEETFDKITFIISKQMLYECVKSNKHTLGYRES